MTNFDVDGFLERFYATPAGQACERLRAEEQYQRDNPVVALREGEVLRRAEVIRASWADRELASSHERKLWRDVLHEIALGAWDARELAAMALYTEEGSES